MNRLPKQQVITPCNGLLLKLKGSSLNPCRARLEMEADGRSWNEQTAINDQVHGCLLHAQSRLPSSPKEVPLCRRPATIASLSEFFSFKVVRALCSGAEFFSVVDKSGNMEHSEHRIIMIIMRKICKIKFSKTEKTSNLEARQANLKLHKYQNKNR